MKTEFDPKTHSYLIDGKPATGVTSIIGVLAKPALIGWAAKMTAEFIRENAEFDGESEEYIVPAAMLEEAKSAHRKKKEDAGSHGTDTHALVEEYIRACLLKDGKPIGDGPDDWGVISKFMAWAIENVDHFLFAERRVYDGERFIAGTADFAYVGKDGKTYMADFKTSSGIYGIDYWLQVAAYRMLAEGEGDKPYDGCTVVRLGKDGKFEVQHLYEYETYRDAFLACLTLYRAQASIKDLIVK